MRVINDEIFELIAQINKIGTKITPDTVNCDALAFRYAGCDLKFSTRPLNRIICFSLSRIKYINGRSAMNCTCCLGANDRYSISMAKNIIILENG